MGNDLCGKGEPTAASLMSGGPRAGRRPCSWLRTAPLPRAALLSCPLGESRSSLGGILQAVGTSLGPARRTCV